MTLVHGCLYGNAEPASVDARRYLLEDLIRSPLSLTSFLIEEIDDCVSLLEKNGIDTVAVWLAVSDRDLASVRFPIGYRIAVDSAICEGTFAP